MSAKNGNFFFHCINSDVKSIREFQKDIIFWKTIDLKKIDIERKEWKDQLNALYKIKNKKKYNFRLELIEKTLEAIENGFVKNECPLCDKKYPSVKEHIIDLVDSKKRIIKELQKINQEIDFHSIEVIRRNNLINTQHKNIKHSIKEKREVKKRLFFHIRGKMKNNF